MLAAACAMFPGQGSQFVGMGKKIAFMSPAAAAVFQEVEEALKSKLSRLMWEGPAVRLFRSHSTSCVLHHLLCLYRAGCPVAN